MTHETSASNLIRLFRFILLPVLSILLIVVLPGQAAGQDETETEVEDTTSPTFVSATTDSTGEHVIVTFSEDLTVPDLVAQIAQEYDLPLGLFYKVVMNITVDGYTNHPASSASLNGNILTIRVETPAIASGQEVRVSYDNIFAVDAAGLFTDNAGNAMANFPSQLVTNIAEYPAYTAFVPGPVVSPDQLTIGEGGSATYTVALPSQPSGEKTVTVSGFPWDIVTVQPSRLTFNQDNWHIPQQVTVNSLDDDYTFNTWAIAANKIVGVSSSSTYEVYVRVVVEDEGEDQG